MSDSLTSIIYAAAAAGHPALKFVSAALRKPSLTECPSGTGDLPSDRLDKAPCYRARFDCSGVTSLTRLRATECSPYRLGMQTLRSNIIEHVANYPGQRSHCVICIAMRSASNTRDAPPR